MSQSVEELFVSEFEDYLPDENATLDAVSANRIVRRIREQKDAISKIEAQEKDEIFMIQARAKELKDAHLAKTEFLLNQYTEMLAKYTEQEIEGKKTRSVKLLNGTIGFRKQPSSLEVEDQDALLEWTKKNMPEAIKVTESVQKTPIKKIVEETGEIPDGAVYIPSTDKFYIE